jgi:energy-coupling factor transport system substrate-specific component
VIPPPFQYPPAAAFAIVAAVIGLMAGGAGGLGLLRPRIGRPVGQLVIGGIITTAVIGGLAYLAYLGYTAILGDTNLAPSSDQTIFVVLGWFALALVLGTVLGLFALLVLRRDLTATYVVVTGMVTGIVAALISAPIAAGVFGGVTGAGTDFLVAAFRQGGADIGAATLGQGLISDPIDKITTFFVVYLIVSAMARRVKARFPQGELLLEEDEAAPEGGEWRGATA